MGAQRTFTGNSIHFEAEGGGSESVAHGTGRQELAHLSFGPDHWTLVAVPALEGTQSWPSMQDSHLKE